VTNPLAWGVDKALEATVVGSFSRGGYAARSRLESWIDPPSLAGRRVLITGATSGIGLAAATRLARLGADLTIVARDVERATRCVEEIRARSTNERVDFLLGDTSDLVAMRRVADEVAQRGDLDVLIHNAGAITATRTLSAQGFEMTVAAQLLGPFLLTTLLLPRLRLAHPGRVLTVASGGLYSQRFDIDHVELSTSEYDGVRAYATVKRAQLVLAHEWVRRVASSEVVFHTMHPGWTDTPGLAASLPSFYRLTHSLLRTPDEGADTLVWLASAREATRSSGRFWLDRRPRSEHKVPWTRSRDADADARALWDWCVERTTGY